MAPHSSTLAWKIPWMEEPGRLQSMGSLRVRHDRATSLLLSCIGKGNGNPPQCSCLENPRDEEAWWAAIYGVTQSWTRLKWLSILSNKEWTIKILDTPPSTPKRQNLKSRLTHLRSLYSGPACVTPGVSGPLHDTWMSDTPHHFKSPDGCCWHVSHNHKNHKSQSSHNTGSKRRLSVGDAHN